MLTLLVRSAAEAAGIDLEAVDVFAVAKGPGSYTGLRVATSVVKGLCFALDKPLVAVNTLETMALQVLKSVSAPGELMTGGDLLLVPMIDARRMEVYCAIYDSEGGTVEETRPVIVESSSFDPWLQKGRMVFFGDGAPKCKPLLEGRENAFFWNAPVHPQASSVGEIAYRRFLEGKTEDAGTFEPFYLKEFMMK